MKSDQPISPDFDPKLWEDVPWLADLLPFPADVAYPMLQSPPPADAVWTYGIAAEEWIAEEMGIQLRHWQKWALRLQWAHRADMTLCYRNIIESTPRRSGKSVRLRSASVYRTAHPDVFGEQQLVLLAGKDTAIVLEHHRKTWKWAKERDWELRRRTGAEEIEAPDGSRFVIRGKDSCYGYDVGYGIVDEAHGVAPTVVDDAIEPSLLDRTCPQLHLVSTSHRKATALMRRRINGAIANGYEDSTSLVMVWAAPQDSDISDPAAWRAANPYWTPERERFMATKYEQALSGQEDPTDDDPDPLSSFASQYLNMGWFAKPLTQVGDPVFTSDEWSAMNGYTPDGPPTVAAVENWFAQGCSVALATKLGDGTVGVTVKDFADVTTAGEFATHCGARVVLAGKALANDPSLVGSRPVAQVVRLALVDLQRFVNEGLIRHDGSPELSDQALALRRVKSADGQRIVSDLRQDALKAVAFAVDEARRSQGIPQIW